MKIIKKLTAFIAAAVVFALTFVHGAEDVSVMLNGEKLSFDVPAQIINDRTMVPMRAIFEALGAQVEWDGETKTITAIRMGNKYNTTVTMRIDDKKIDKEIWDMKYDSDPHIALYGSNETIELDTAPMIVNDRTLVPVRAVAESLDCVVDWDAEQRTVLISGEETTADISVPEATPAPTPTPTVAPTPAPVSSGNLPIAYNEESERGSGSARDFELKSVVKNAEGKYEITYSIQTFLEGRGTVQVVFNCLDRNGKVIDTFGGGFVGTDYTWSPHEASAVISGDTVLIELLQK